MDIVYVYKDGIDGGESLKMSLMSVARRCKFVDRVFIVCSERCGVDGEFCEERGESMVAFCPMLEVSGTGALLPDGETSGTVAGDTAGRVADDGARGYSQAGRVADGWRVALPCYVRVIRHEDRYNRKHKNILDALMDVVKRTDVGCYDGGVFMYSSDDHWFVKDFDCRFGASEVWIKGNLHSQKSMLKMKKAGKKVNNWVRSMVETREVLNRMGYPTVDFSQHANTWFNAEMMKEDYFLELVKEAQEGVWGCEPSCLMMNYWITRRPYEIGNEFVLRHRRDFKVGGEWTVEKLREEYVKNGERECISGSDGVIGNDGLYGEIMGMIMEG